MDQDFFEEASPKQITSCSICSNFILTLVPNCYRVASSVGQDVSWLPEGRTTKKSSSRTVRNVCAKSATTKKAKDFLQTVVSLDHEICICSKNHFRPQNTIMPKKKTPKIPTLLKLPTFFFLLRFPPKKHVFFLRNVLENSHLGGHNTKALMPSRKHKAYTILAMRRTSAPGWLVIGDGWCSPPKR